MKRINKIQMFSFVIVITVLLTSSIVILNKNTTNSKAAINIGFSSSMYEINTIDDLVKYSDNVIIGTVMGEEKIDDSLVKYIVSTNKSIKGNVSSSDIDVYEAKNTLHIGAQYILFLGYFDSALYPREVYTSIEKDCIIEINNNKILSRSKFVGKDASLQEVFNIIEKSSKIKFDNKKTYTVKNEHASLKELTEASEYIVQVLTKEVTYINKYVSNAQTDVVHQYKGDIGNTNTFTMPSNLENGKEYILFLTKTDDGSLVLTSRKGSIICKDNLDEWNKVKASLE